MQKNKISKIKNQKGKLEIKIKKTDDNIAGILFGRII